MIKRNSKILFIIVLLLSVVACSKRDKLQSSNVLIDITPSYANVLPQTETTFTATVKSPDGKKIDKQVTWSADIGNITNKGVYTAPTITVPTTAKISAAVDNIVRTINIRIVNELPIRADRYYFYADEFARDDPYVSKLKLDAANPGDENGGYLGKIGGSDLDFGGCATVFYEGAESLKLQYTNANSGVGIYFQFGFIATGNPGQPVVTDMSAYNTVKFAFKAENFNTDIFTVKVIKGNGAEYDYTVNPNNYLDWGIVTFNVAASMSDFKQLVFVTAGTKTTGVFYIDDIYFCK